MEDNRKKFTKLAYLTEKMDYESDKEDEVGADPQRTVESPGR